MATLAIAAGDLNSESDNQQAGAGEPVRASPRTVRNRRNREAQQRKQLVKKADLLGKLWPQTNTAVFTWSPGQHSQLFLGLSLGSLLSPKPSMPLSMDW